MRLLLLALLALVLLAALAEAHKSKSKSSSNSDSKSKSKSKSNSSSKSKSSSGSKSKSKPVCEDPGLAEIANITASLEADGWNAELCAQVELLKGETDEGLTSERCMRVLAKRPNQKCKCPKKDGTVRCGCFRDRHTALTTALDICANPPLVCPFDCLNRNTAPCFAWQLIGTCCTSAPDDETCRLPCPHCATLFMPIRPACPERTVDDFLPPLPECVV